MRILHSLLVLLSIHYPASAQTSAPATQPVGPFAFQLVQEHQLPDGEKSAVRFQFSGHHAIMVDSEGDPIAFYNCAAKTAYVERHGRMVDDRFIDALLDGWRLGAGARMLLSDDRNEPFVRSLLWPKVETTEDEGKILIRTKAIHLTITPMKDADPDEASRYADVYKLESYRDALENDNKIATFLVREVSDILRKRGVIPELMEIETFTPRGSAKLIVTLRRETITDNEANTIQALAAQLDPPATQPSTKPARG